MYIIRAHFLLLAIAVIPLTTSVNATQFEFSYTFTTDGTIVTGSFDGTANGNRVENLSNIQVSYDTGGGVVALDGPLFGTGVDSMGLWQAGIAYASFDGLENNFLFTNSNYPVDTGHTNFFKDVDGQTPSGEPRKADPDHIQLWDSLPTPQWSEDTYSVRGDWTLTPANSVGTSGNTAFLLLGSLAGLQVLRARRKG